MRLVATDVDGTLTREGALAPEVLGAIARLVAAGIEVVPVSGRSAGEVLGIVRYLPGVRRGIAENGLVEVIPDAPVRLLGRDRVDGDPPADRSQVREAARRIGDAVGLPLSPTPDDVFRIADVAFERAGRTDEELGALAAAIRAESLHVTWSNVHVHVTREPPDKGRAVLAAAGVEPLAIATIGDAPNDAGLFVAGRFGLTVGTADVPRQAAVMPHMPEFVTAHPEAEAFLELAAWLLLARG
ncbi:MAG TPA: HAD hydrolase family protein [Nannocystaceae bacterium]|nr:HAD hydrolase family protein [Nannocystaceae bacterium]